MGPNEVTPLNQNFSACAQKNYFRSASAQREILSAAHSLAERRMSGTQFKKKKFSYVYIYSTLLKVMTYEPK